MNELRLATTHDNDDKEMTLMTSSVTIDREQSPMLRLLVVCRDSGQPVRETVRQLAGRLVLDLPTPRRDERLSLTWWLVIYRETVRQLMVKVDDVNDHAPQFTRSVYNVSVRENQRPPLVCSAYNHDRNNS